MAENPALPSIVAGDIAPDIVRVTAKNAGPFTSAGTNSYLAGTHTLAVIDPGPDDAGHREAIRVVAAGRPISHILLTHTHRDHSDGLAALRQTTGARTFAMGRAAFARPADSRAASPSGGDFADWDFVPDHRLEAGSVVDIEPGLAVEAVHTPGHAPDHLCFAVRGRPVLFTGDHVMGWSTSVIAPPEGNMGDYLRSLEGLLARTETLYLPGHGDPLGDGPRTARAYLIHRQMREAAVVDAIRGGARTIPAIAAIVYSGIAPALSTAARLSVQAHVEHLAEKHLLTFAHPLTPERLLTLSS